MMQNRFFRIFAVLLIAGFLAQATPGQSRAQGAPTPLGPQGQSPQTYQPPPPPPGQQPYQPPPAPQQGGYPPPPPPQAGNREDTFSSDEILNAGHKFFGRVSTGLARVVEYAFSQSGRPNGYVLGEEAGGAFVAGLRYGEGVLHTKDAGQHKVFWQGPSIGYDFGAEGSKTMILVYDLRTVDEMYGRFAGVDGSAYFIGGVGMTLQKRDNVTLAPIRSGVGLRLGANVGYLKFTRQPTWNPF